MVNRMFALLLAFCLLFPLGAPGVSTARAEVQLPGDLQLVATYSLPRYGLTYERYQQTFGPALVLGGQLTGLRGADGALKALIGAHYPQIQPTNAVRLSHQEA
ncbi:MAG TPA: hypothetical protein VLS48_06915, partial [Anaerolineales bacterium]|nr:hypothetical protein [Anaerolineales bacterium]